MKGFGSIRCLQRCFCEFAHAINKQHATVKMSGLKYFLYTINAIEKVLLSL